MGAWLLLVAGCTVDDEGKPSEPERTPSAIVLIVDGVRTDEFCGTEPSELTGVPGDAMAPEVWAELAPAGTYSRNALNTGVTITAPAHAALLTGHNETYANFSINADEGPGLYRPLRPTIFEATLARLGVPKEEVVLLSNTTLLEGVTRSVDPDPNAAHGATWTLVADAVEDDGWPAADSAVLDELRRLIDEGPPRLVVVNLHDVDRAGHYSDAPVYPARIGEVDAQIGEFWRWVQDEHPDYAEDLLLVVTADHGRHRTTADEDWRNHGDACDGCRETPLFVVGGGAAAGAEYATAPLALDIPSTVAAHLGVAMPWAEGLPLDGFDGVVRSGEVALSTSGELVATQVWRDDAAARSEIVVNGEVLSTPGALGAEAPTVLDATGGRMACWRELADTGDHRPWTPRCLADTGAGWVDVGFPVAEVNPFWQVSLAERDGRIYATWAENANAAAEHRAGTVGLGVASWTAADGWSPMYLSDGYFPTDPTFVANDEVMVAAYGTSLEDPASRYTRRVRVVPYVLSDGAPEPVGFTDFYRDDARLELPALTADGARLDLALLVFDAEGTHLEAFRSDDGGRTWGSPVRLPDATGAPAPRLAPAWDGADLVWITEDGGDSAVCRATPIFGEGSSAEGGDAATCTSVGSPRVHSFAVHDGGVTVIRDAGVAAWERAEVGG